LKNLSIFRRINSFRTLFHFEKKKVVQYKLVILVSYSNSSFKPFRMGRLPKLLSKHTTPLDLADVYAVIAYYMKHRQQIEDYLAEREKTAKAIQEKIEARQPDFSPIRNRLLAYRNKSKDGD